MRKLIRRLLLPLAVTVAVTTVATPARAADPVDLDHGHVDVFGVGYENGRLNLHVHDGETDTEYAPSAVRLIAKPAARTTVPDDPAFGFLGRPGDDVWILPQVQDPELLFAGVAAEEVPAGVFRNEALRVDVLAVYGPADFDVFTTGPDGTPTVLVDSGNGLPDPIDVTAGGHRHVNWAFEASGTYRVVARASGVLASNGKRVYSTPAIYTFRADQ